MSGAFQASRNRISRSLNLHTLKSTVFDEQRISKESVSGGRNLPPLLQDMADERREFELNLGKAMDTLRKDYPYMLHKTPGAYSHVLKL